MMLAHTVSRSVGYWVVFGGLTLSGGVFCYAIKECMASLKDILGQNKNENNTSSKEAA